MKAAGSDLGVAWTWQEYIDWGVRMGRDEGLRQQMRSQLEQGKQPDSLAPLWNPRKFAADMYNIFKDLVGLTGRWLVPCPDNSRQSCKDKRYLSHDDW